MNENTISSNLTRIKDATDDIRSTLGTPGAAIEDVASDVATLSTQYNQMASDYNDLIIENNQLRQQIADITPKGTININENGTINVGPYASAIVNVGSVSGWITINKLSVMSLSTPFEQTGARELRASFVFPAHRKWIWYVDIIYKNGVIETRKEYHYNEASQTMTISRFFSGLQQNVTNIAAIEIRDEEYSPMPEVDAEIFCNIRFSNWASTYGYNKDITLYWCDENGDIIDAIQTDYTTDESYSMFVHIPSFAYYKIGVRINQSEYYSNIEYLTYDNPWMSIDVEVEPWEVYINCNFQTQSGESTYGYMKEIGLINMNSGEEIAMDTTEEDDYTFTVYCDQLVPGDTQIFCRVTWIDGNQYDGDPMTFDDLVDTYDLITVVPDMSMVSFYAAFNQELDGVNKNIILYHCDEQGNVEYDITQTETTGLDVTLECQADNLADGDYYIIGLQIFNREYYSNVMQYIDGTDYYDGGTITINLVNYALHFIDSSTSNPVSSFALQDAKINIWGDNGVNIEIRPNGMADISFDCPDDVTTLYCDTGGVSTIYGYRRYYNVSTPWNTIDGPDFDVYLEQAIPEDPDMEVGIRLFPKLSDGSYVELNTTEIRNVQVTVGGSETVYGVRGHSGTAANGWTYDIGANMKACLTPLSNNFTLNLATRWGTISQTYNLADYYRGAPVNPGSIYSITVPIILNGGNE